MYKYFQTQIEGRLAMEQQRIAVIGGGISGLATAWLLQRHHEVRLFEREPDLGGHAHTVEIPDAQGPVAVDTGFVVYNERNYPLLTQLFATLGVPTQETEMSFSYALQPGGIEYAGSSLNTLFAQRRNLLRPRFLRMTADILRFNRLGKRQLAEPEMGPATGHRLLGDFLIEHRFGRGFIEDYLLPMAAAIWSCPTATLRRFPVRGFLEFFRNHGLLDLGGRPQWRTVIGGSQTYVQRLAQTLVPGSVFHHGVQRIHRLGADWQVTTAQGTDRFDAVVFACHADTALALLAAPTPEQAAVLGACRFQDNRALLHTDIRLMPSSPRVWSAWNYLAQRQDVSETAVSVSYYMNRLHRLDRRTHYMVSLNPWQEPHPTTVLGEYHWRHPVLDAPAIAAQDRIEAIQGQDGLYLAGAWTGYGFHEDGLRSAVRVARCLGIAPPWEAASSLASRPALVQNAQNGTDRAA